MIKQNAASPTYKAGTQFFSGGYTEETQFTRPTDLWFTLISCDNLNDPLTDPNTNEIYGYNTELPDESNGYCHGDGFEINYNSNTYYYLNDDTCEGSVYKLYSISSSSDTSYWQGTYQLE